MANDPTVLVAEDDDAIRRLIELTIRPFATVHGAGNGAEALAWLRSNPAPDLLVTDIMMPGLDGLTLAKLVKRDPKLQRMPIIFLTAKSRPMDVVNGINAGARHYLTKPFDRNELLSKVKDILGIRG
ncbi:MAG: response regulator [Sandaracinus sp.]|nr:response regulator [Sandaracinus sp.]|tara:strand:+ start:593 stop:973 length:381 start_codon:yes stop_codon:yes gene_type:complete